MMELLHLEKLWPRRCCVGLRVAGVMVFAPFLGSDAHSGAASRRA